jgi:hypothetical protein
MFALKPIIFNFFGLRDKTQDVNPDVNGRGLHQRFIELLAGDLDDNELTLINMLVENTGNPLTCFEIFIPYREGTFGTPTMSADIYIRRKIISMIKTVNQRKGSKWGYIILFNMIGITNTVFTEVDNLYGFDQGGTFDTHNFDMRCISCSGYSLTLTGSAPLTAALQTSIEAIIAYNQPINAYLISITYNGAPLSIEPDFNSDFNSDFYTD